MIIFAMFCTMLGRYVHSKDFIYLLLERGEVREREGEKHQCVVASHMLSTGDLPHNPGVFPDWESNWRPFGLQPGTQSTELHQPGPMLERYLEGNIIFLI